MALLRVQIIVMSALVITHIFVIQGFKIPLPFGSLSVSKDKNNETNVDMDNSINILGYGTSSGLSVGAKNGSITTKTSSGVLVNGANYGSNSTLREDKSKGLAVDTDLNVGKDSVRGGLGKETSFIQGLLDLIGKNKLKKN